jgi:glycosyl transferase family 87
MSQLLKKIISSPLTVAAIYCALVIVATCQSYFLKPSGEGAAYTYFNNYIIFRQSFFHLVHGKDLYLLYGHEYFDLYKYSPAFALFFGLFAYLPDFAGLLLWNLLNCAVLACAVYALPRLEMRHKTLMLLLCSIELMTSIQDSQSNALVAGLLIFSFGFFERGRIWQATLCIVLTAFIKIFGVLFLLLFLFYPQKPKALLSASLWGLLLIVAPLAVAGATGLWQQYLSWYKLLGNDHSMSSGISVFSWVNTWLRLYPDKAWLLAGGALTLLVTLLKVLRQQVFSLRLALFSSMLIWVVIFNHKAESPSYIIAVAGVCLWYFNGKATVWHTLLFILVLVFTCLSVTDLFPRGIRELYFLPYAVKAVPCIFVWLEITRELLFYRPAGQQLP